MHLVLSNNFFAFASVGETITLYNASNMVRLSRLRGGEYIKGVRFSNSGRYLGALNTFQGGGFVGIYRVKGDSLRTLYRFSHKELGRETPLEDFADTFGRTAFSPDDRSVIVFASNSNCGSNWFAELICIHRPQGKCTWITPIDKSLIPDLEEVKKPVLTEIAFNPAGDRIAVGLHGARMLEFNVHDGTLTQVLHLDTHSTIYAVAYENYSGRLWAMDEHYLLSCVTQK